jgi:hypothetical protein
MACTISVQHRYLQITQSNLQDLQFKSSENETKLDELRTSCNHTPMEAKNPTIQSIMQLN